MLLMGMMHATSVQQEMDDLFTTFKSKCNQRTLKHYSKKIFIKTTRIATLKKKLQEQIEFLGETQVVAAAMMELRGPTQDQGGQGSKGAEAGEQQQLGKGQETKAAYVIEDEGEDEAPPAILGSTEE